MNIYANECTFSLGGYFFFSKMVSISNVIS
jgi:hypothetical protein